MQEKKNRKMNSPRKCRTWSKQAKDAQSLRNKEKAKRKFVALKGKRVQLIGGLWIIYTGNLCVVQYLQTYYRPELRCENSGHTFPCFSSHALPPNCPQCVKENGGKAGWRMLRQQCSRFSLSIDDLLKIRKAQTNPDGIVCCAICKILENEERLCIDHNHLCCDKRTSCGLCVRRLLCRACNQIVGLIESGRIRKNFAPKQGQYIDKYRR